LLFKTVHSHLHRSGVGLHLVFLEHPVFLHRLCDGVWCKLIFFLMSSYLPHFISMLLNFSVFVGRALLLTFRFSLADPESLSMQNQLFFYFRKSFLNLCLNSVFFSFGSLHLCYIRFPIIKIYNFDISQVLLCYFSLLTFTTGPL
jgi:hypothetical protein